MSGTAGVRNWSRRLWLGGAAATGLGGIATLLYRQSPGFWKQYFREMSRPILPPPVRPRPEQWPDKGLYAAWLGHASVLLKVDGFTILTDPVFSDRVGLNIGPVTLGVKRLVEPAMEMSRLPRVDLILLSHAHMDHFDIPSLRALERRDVAVVTATGTSDLLRVPNYGRVTELGWNRKTRVGPAELQAFRVNHWGARMRTDTYRGYNAYVIESGRWKVLFGGDTAITEAFRTVRNSKAFDLTIMPIGAYNPWIRYHCTPEEAWRMGNDAHSEFLMPVHYRTFMLSREPLDEPLQRFQEAAGREADRIALRRIGQEFRLT